MECTPSRDHHGEQLKGVALEVCTSFTMLGSGMKIGKLHIVHLAENHADVASTEE